MPEVISIKDAKQIAKDIGINVTLATLYKWLDGGNKNIVHQPGGPNTKIFVHKKEFIEFISGKKEQEV